jgi:septal ring factor EnvC (AmiA/AmiB activator)
MRYFILVAVILINFYSHLYGQSRAELEDRQKRTLEEISYVDKLLKSTSKEKIESINSVKILGNKLNLRESVIKEMESEMELLNERIGINRQAIDMMESDLIIMKEDYSRAIINSYKSEKVNPEIVYILSARDFNQGYKRLKYLQQIAKFRRNEAEIIAELKSQIEDTKSRLENDLNKISDLQHREIIQRQILQDEQTKQQRLISTLGNKEKQLRKDLDEKKKIERRIESEIARIVEEEKKRRAKSEMTPEQKLIGENFADNKGRLPWPVEKGIITNHFGLHQHPVLKYVTEENYGIEITSSGKTLARSIFKGEVTAISAISGANMTVIIRHGKYLTVYSNLIKVKVKTGDLVDTKQEIGQVFEDSGDNNNCIIKFMIFEQKYLDPEDWIAKM